MNNEQENMDTDSSPFDNDGFENDGFEGDSFKISYKDIRSDEMAEDFYLCKYFLETSRGHKKVFDWFQWLDTDTLIYTDQCAVKLSSEVNEFTIDEKIDGDSMAQDFHVFCALCYSKEFPSKELNEDEFLDVYKRISFCVELCLRFKENTAKVSDYGDGSIFGSTLKVKMTGEEDGED